MRSAALIGVVALAGCAAISPSPSEIPIGGVRAPITEENLAAAREGMSGGLLEPSWLPAGFELVNADYSPGGGRVDAVDLAYAAGDAYVHVWQAHISPRVLGSTDPVALGDPLPGTSWRIYELPPANTGGEPATEYSIRLDDGRTVTVDSNLSQETMLRILDGMIVRVGP